MKLFLGLDAGRSGGYALISDYGSLLDVGKMPLTSEGETDAKKLLKIILEHKKEDVYIHIAFERLNSFFGMSQAGIIGISREGGIVESVSQISEIPYTKINPRKWQNFIFANEKQIFKEEKGKAKLDTKKMAANKFVKSFPDYKEFDIITKNTGNLRDGIVDAALIALYAKMNNF